MKRTGPILILILVSVLVVLAIFFWFSGGWQKLPVAEVEKGLPPASIPAPAQDVAMLPLTTDRTVSSSVSLIFGGDVMLSRVVGQRLEKYHDYAWPFRFISSTLAEADLAIVNLESPFTIKGSHFVPTGSFSFNADPQAIVGLKQSGIDLVDLANNHFINQGERGMLDTFQVLKDGGIGYVGAGQNFDRSHQPWIEEISGLRIGFLAYGYPNDNSVATASSSGINALDATIAKQDIKKLKNKADLIIVMIHAGVEYTNQPNSQQKNFAHQAIDAGADLVIGHHPHWVQKTEIYHGRPVVYSLGNLVFDQMWSRETQQGALARVDISDKKIKAIKILPLHIYDYGQSQLVTSSAERQEILSRMGLTHDNISLAD
ncbi:MAG: CapA family protein [Patescibacteria group bacterium]